MRWHPTRAAHLSESVPQRRKHLSIKEDSASHADCCIVGGGPAGMVLGLLLARVGLKVTVLESQPDFDRDFRGDTLHASTLKMLNQIGLADRVLELPHVKLREMSLNAGDRSFQLADCIPRVGEWQIGYVFPKGDFHEVRERGMATFRADIAATVPWLADRSADIEDFSDVHLLNVKADCLPVWHQNG